MANFEIEKLQMRGAAVRSYFRYQHIDSTKDDNTQDEVNTITASNVIMQHICNNAKSNMVSVLPYIV